jgi:DNA-directed RNA polymerase alpha subunit
MSALTKNKKLCKNGHTYYKSSDCPVCPVCEKEHNPQNNFLSRLAAPARRALENKGIKTVKQLSKYSETEILKLHGMGRTSMPILHNILKTEGVSFKKD